VFLVFCAAGVDMIGGFRIRLFAGRAGEGRA